MQITYWCIIHPVKWVINHKQHYHIARRASTEKTSESKKGAAAFLWNNGALQSRESYFSVSIAQFICSKLPQSGGTSVNDFHI